MEKRNLPFKAKSTPIELLLLIVALICLALASCSPTASLPNGCKYKLIAPKFTK